jgi:Ser/Thr protein kinase RdoA (MazF antagonist)
MPTDVLPGLATAFDEEAMKGHLQSALFGQSSEYVVERCRPVRPLYMPGPSCLLRYRVHARSTADGTGLEPIVTGRVFPDRSSCSSYMRERLAPVAAGVRGRPEVAAFATPAAVIEPLHTVVHVWPVDGELPGLVQATDRERMVEVFQETLGNTVEDCEIELVRYRRRQRCVLRYTVVGEDGRRVVYGKVSGVGTETPKDVIVGELHRRMTGHSLSVPRSLGWWPELQLSLLEALPGEAQIGPALAARLRGASPPGALSLEEMVAACGHAAAALHGSGIDLGPARTIGEELAGLERDMAIVRPFVPDPGRRARAWFEQVAALAEQSAPLRPCLSHGDFKYEQLLFDGPRSALVDFDAVCQSEPALDLGKFLAHLRVDAPLGDELAEEFLRAYVSASRPDDEPQLRVRTALYEALSLLHLTLWSQRNLDETGLRATTKLLEERLSVSS